MSDIEDYELVFENITEAGSVKKRIGRSKATGAKVVEMLLDEHGRQIEVFQFNDDGTLNKRIVYVHDQSRKPLLISAYDANGKLIYRQERGKRPEEF